MVAFQGIESAGGIFPYLHLVGATDKLLTPLGLDYMQDRIPLPTDNIFKFYALFGLLLFIFAAGSGKYIIRTTNDLAFQTKIDLADLNQVQNPTPVETAKRQVFEKRLEIAAADESFLLKATGGILAFGVILMFFGFQQWHMKIQPIEDETARLQLEKLRHEVEVLKHPASESGHPPAATPGKKQQRH